MLICDRLISIRKEEGEFKEVIEKKLSDTTKEGKFTI